MATHLDHGCEAPRWQSHETLRGTFSNPFVSKCDFLLIISSCVELFRPAYVSHYGLRGGGVCEIASSPSKPVSTCCCCCCTFGRAGMRSGGEVKEEKSDDSSSVLSAGVGPSLAAPQMSSPPRSPTARWSGADKARPWASALPFTLELNHSLSA